MTTERKPLEQISNILLIIRTVLEIIFVFGMIMNGIKKAEEEHGQDSSDDPQFVDSDTAQ